VRQFFKILAHSHVLHFDRPAFAIFNRLFEAVAEFIEVRELETLVFATKRDELASIYQTYLPKGSTKIEELDCRLEGPIRVDPYGKASNSSVENFAVKAGYFEIASITPTAKKTRPSKRIWVRRERDCATRSGQYTSNKEAPLSRSNCGSASQCMSLENGTGKRSIRMPRPGRIIATTQMTRLRIMGFILVFAPCLRTLPGCVLH
jgi:hypothetical protein